MIFCLLTPLSFCSLLQTSSNASWRVFPSIKNFLTVTFPGTLVCNKTTHHLQKNQGWLEEGSTERRIDACDVCWKHCYPSQAFIIPTSSVSRGRAGHGLVGTALLLGVGKPSMLKATGKYSNSSAWVNLDFPFASISPPAFPPAWLFSSYD